MDYIGYIVSLDCGEKLGVYQGQVKAISTHNQSLILTNPFRNGLRCENQEIALSAKDINSIKILKSPRDAHQLYNKRATPSKLTKPVEKVAACARISPVKQVSTVTQSSSQIPGGPKTTNTHRHSRDETGKSSNSLTTGVIDDGAIQPTNRSKPTTPRKNDNTRKRQTPRQDCFNVPIDSFNGEFDFEKNLALFDKKMSLLEFETRDDGKYKGTEDVLNKKPTVLRQIILPKSKRKEYTTDSGLVVPSVLLEERLRLQQEADMSGYNETRLLEAVGRSASEMVMQLLGGSNRLNPSNHHQLPEVVILCGPHMQGALGVSAARNLANHNIPTTLYMPTTYKTSYHHLASELTLYAASGRGICSDIAGLPSVVDLIVYAMDCQQEDPCRVQPWFRVLTDWANCQRAPVFAIDPPSSQVVISAKWSLAVGMPFDLPKNLGQVYLCDVGWPKKVFQNCNIRYISPFGHKLVIPLYDRDQ